MKKNVRLFVLCLALLLPVLTACGKAAAPQASPAPLPVSPAPAAPVEAEDLTEAAALPVYEEAEEAAEPGLYPQYRELVERVAQGVRAGWSDVTPEELGVTDMFKRLEEQQLGWLQLDINGDGRDELLIGEITPDGEVSPIYDIFSLPGDALMHPASGWEFNRWYLLGNGHLMNEVSGTGFDRTRSAYGFFNGALVPTRDPADRSEYLHLPFESFDTVLP